MPLDDDYGVVIGTMHDYFRDPVNDYGQYYHANAIMRTPAGTYHCAIDVDSKGLPNGVEWRVVELGKSDMHGVDALPHGWYSLPSNADSGALDYVRSPNSAQTRVAFSSYPIPSSSRCAGCRRPRSTLPGGRGRAAMRLPTSSPSSKTPKLVRLR
jgi:hypothetical protein